MRATLAPAVAVVIAACSNGSSGHTQGSGNDFASKMCAKVTACSFSIPNCQSSFAAQVLSGDCQSAFLNASCSDLSANPPPPAIEACIPNCTGTMNCTGASASVTNATCNGDGTVTQCTNGSQFTYSCDGICAAENKTYAGTCGLTFDEQLSPTGCPACWCQ